MHKYVTRTWNLATAFILAVSFFIVITSHWVAPGEALLFVVLGSIAIAGLVTWVTRNDAEKWARFLSVLVLGLVCGFCVSLVFLLIGAVQRLGIPWAGTSIAIGCAVMLAFYVLTHRKLMVAVLVTVIVVVATTVTFSVYFKKQTKMLDEYAELWRSKGWPNEMSELYPAASTLEQCRPWVTICEKTANEELSVFYSDIGKFSGRLAAALETGSDVRQLVQDSALPTDDRWQALSQLNREATSAAKQCPRMVYFNPADFADNPWDIPIPNLLGLIRWSRGMVVEANQLAAQGQFVEAEELCFELVDASRSMQHRSPCVIEALISIAMERMAVITLTSIQTINQEPWTDEQRARVEGLSEADPSFLFYSFEVERYLTFKACSSPPEDGFEGWMTLDGVPTWAPMQRAAVAYECREAMVAHTQVGDFFTEKPNFPEGRFAWHEARRELIPPDTSSLVPNLSNAYARLINLRAQWRLTLAVDSVLRSYKESGTLAQGAEDLGDVTWGIDPFDEQPLRYRNLDDTAFVVYSIGPDEIDANGEELYVSGVLELDREFDIGYHFTLR